MFAIQHLDAKSLSPGVKRMAIQQKMKDENA